MKFSNDDYGLAAYFEFLTVEIHRCSGSPSVNGSHLEVHSPPQRSSHYQVSKNEQYMYGSSIKHWFEKITSINTSNTTRKTCWRVKEGVPLCPGERLDSARLVISIPILLIIEAPEDPDPSSFLKFRNLPPWDFPPTLTPSSITKTEAKQRGITYDLIGLGLFSQDSHHFIARYIDKKTSQIYTYDSMKNKGFAVLEKEAKLATHIAGHVQANIPPTFAPSLAVYLLHGGTNAQQAFYETQTQTCSKKFNLRFSSVKLSLLPDVTYHGHDCAIELEQHRKKGLKEYVSKRQTGPAEPESSEHEGEDPVSSNASPPALDDGPESEEETIPHRKPALSSINTNPDLPQPSTPDSPPDSPFNIKCCCGLEGDGNVYYDEKDGEAVQCTECECWSHIACQKNGWASKLRLKEAYFCDFCQVRVPGMAHLEKFRAADRR